MQVYGDWTSWMDNSYATHLQRQPNSVVQQILAVALLSQLFSRSGIKNLRVRPTLNMR